MANYIGAARGNYFEVEDEALFLEWVEKLPGVVARKREAKPSREQDNAHNSRPRYTLLAEDTDGAGWPSWRYSEGGPDEEPDEGDEGIEIDLADELSTHLAPGSVAVLEEAGSEKLRYLVGYATAVNHLGQTITVSISDVYHKAVSAGWTDHVEDARY